MTRLMLSLVAIASLGVAPATATFAGVISDSMCADNHKPMQMEPTDGGCAIACHDEHGAAYVLVDGRTVYQLSDQDTPKRFAGKRVKVVGTLDAATNSITVASIGAE